MGTLDSPNPRPPNPNPLPLGEGTGNVQDALCLLGEGPGIGPLRFIRLGQLQSPLSPLLLDGV